MDAWAAYLRGQADALDLPVYDTGSMSQAAVVDALVAQVETLIHHEGRHARRSDL
jgi:hypothetical protein